MIARFLEPIRKSGQLIKKLFLVVLLFAVYPSVAQELEPRAYGSLPKNTNVLVAAYAYSSGNVLTDPAMPIENAKLSSHNMGLGYVRTFGLAKKLARVQVILPLAFMKGSLLLNGVDTAIFREGVGDARIRFGINLVGSPALDKKDFRHYQQNTIFGFSFVVSVPIGLYYNNKTVNLGSNRWAFKPEMGISHRFRNCFAELYTGVWLYMKNNDYMSGKIQQQEPILSTQAHFSYYFKNQVWIGLDGNWFNGGKTIVNNISANNLMNNWRVGSTVSFPIAKQQTLKFLFHVGAFTNAGYNYSVVSVGYQYVFF